MIFEIFEGEVVGSILGFFEGEASGGDGDVLGCPWGNGTFVGDGITITITGGTELLLPDLPLPLSLLPW